MKRIRSWLLLVILLLVVGFFFYLPQLLKVFEPAADHHAGHTGMHADHQSSVTGAAHSPTQRCSLNAGICSVALSGGRQLQFAISPRMVPAMRPVQLEAQVQGGDAQQIRVLVEGRDMYMGEQVVNLVKAEAGRFTGELIVPACDMDHQMVWLAQVDVIDAEQTDQIVFEFTATQ